MTGGRGYKNDVIGYLTDKNRKNLYETVYQTPDGSLDIVLDKLHHEDPSMPIFSNSPGKIYALLGRNGKIKSIGFFDETHRLVKSIHLDHDDGPIKGIHVHMGDAYHHKFGESRRPTSEEEELIRKVLALWAEKGGTLC